FLDTHIATLAGNWLPVLVPGTVPGDVPWLPVRELMSVTMTFVRFTVVCISPLRYRPQREPRDVAQVFSAVVVGFGVVYSPYRTLAQFVTPYVPSSCMRAPIGTSGISGIADT